MNTFTSRLFYSTEITTMWPDPDGLFALMVDAVMSTTGKSQEDATALLNTEATFPGRSKATTVQRKPVKVLRGAVPHLMTAIKNVAAKAFFERYHQLKGVGTRVEKPREGARARPRGSNSSLVFSRNGSAKCLWMNSFLTTTAGFTSMQAVVAAVVGKWANIDDFLVPASSRIPEEYYKISSLLYGLLVMKVRACCGASCVRLCVLRLVNGGGAWCLSLREVSYIAQAASIYAGLCRPRPRFVSHILTCEARQHDCLFPPTAVHVLLSFLQVRVALRASAGLPRLIWGGDHIDEGHRKLLAAELLGSRQFIPDDDGVHNGFLFIDAAVPGRRRVPGFGVRGLVEILKRMKLTERPTFAAETPGAEDNEDCAEDDVVVSDYSDDSAPSYSFDLSVGAADDLRAGVGRSGVPEAAGVRNRARGQNWGGGDPRVGEASDCEDEAEGSQYWGLGDDGQGARWDDDDGRAGSGRTSAAVPLA